MSSLMLSAPLRFCSTCRYSRGNKKPRLLQRRGQNSENPAVPPCLAAPSLPVIRPSLGGLAPATPARTSRSSQPDRSPARLRGEFGILPAPVFHQPPALWSRTQRPYYSPSMPYCLQLSSKPYTAARFSRKHDHQ